MAKKIYPSHRSTSFKAILTLYKRKMKKTLESVTKQDIVDLFKKLNSSSSFTVYRVPGCGYNVFFKSRHEGENIPTLVIS